MKIFITVFCLTVLATDCASTKAGLSTLEPKAEKTFFIYKKYTRGFYNEFHIGEEKITSYLNYQKTEISEKSTGKKHWEYCLKLLKDIDLKNFSYLEAPSNLRQTDRVLHGVLTLKIKEKDFIASCHFDHGNPPEKIKVLVEHLLDISGAESH
jgi:hypothetical protein|tara:strand:- start:2260 stop:2718 length:459 start_codon:yes stop_codon:yes gene_type:complete